MKSPDIVPDKLTSNIDFRIITIIVIGVLSYHITTNYVVDDPTVIVYVVSMAIPLTVAIFSFKTAKQYSGMLVYGRGYNALGIGFIGLFLGELTYLIYEQFLGLDPYPSVADVFFYLLYPMTIIYLILNIRFFSTKLSMPDKFLIGLISSGITLFYIIFSIVQFDELNFDFYYGIAFVAAISITLALSIQGVKIFRDGVVGTSWILLMIGVLMFTVGDVWYYYIELFDGYSLDHPVLLMWYFGYLLILYSLLQHKKAI